MSEEFLDKPAFMAAHGVSARTVDAWVAKGRVERIQDVDRRAYFRLLPPGSPAAPPSPPAWAVALAEDIARLEAKLDALGAAERVPAAPLLGSPVDAAPPRPRWRRLLGID